jgi:transcriptional regulator GlxA family with amidase domain
MKSNFGFKLSAVLACAIAIVAVVLNCNPRPVAAAEGPARKVRTLGILVFPGFELLDAYGPLEMWGNLKGEVKVIVVAREKGEITSAQGPKTVAEYGFKDCPKLDLVLIPGGFGVRPLLKDAATLDWLRERFAQSEITMSVCNGASLLAAAGLLDGRPATTNKAYWEMATEPGPKVNWVKRARWVDDGNIVTSSGVSAGMDMTLHVIERLFGSKAAEGLAKGTEYEWHRDPKWDPFAEVHGLVPAESK